MNHIKYLKQFQNINQEKKEEDINKTTQEATQETTQEIKKENKEQLINTSNLYISFLSNDITINDLFNKDNPNALINLKNTTFIMSIRVDHEDRLNNLKVVLIYLLYHFDTTIIIIENGPKSHFDHIKNILTSKQLSNLNYEFQYSNNNLFHKTQVLNDCLRKVKTSVISSYDVDCLLPLKCYVDAEQLLLNNTYDAITPFNVNTAIHIKQHIKLDLKIKYITDGNYSDLQFKSNISHLANAGYGYVLFLQTNKYKEIKGENENFLAYGPEDVERIHRIKKFNLKYARFKNYNIYHLEHYRSPNSSEQNPHFLSNHKLYEELINMSDKDYLSYYNKIKINF